MKASDELRLSIAELTGSPVVEIDIEDIGEVKDATRPGDEGTWRNHLLGSVWGPRLKGALILDDDGQLLPPSTIEADLPASRRKYVAELRTAISRLERMPACVSLQYWKGTTENGEHWHGWSVGDTALIVHRVTDINEG